MSRCVTNKRKFFTETDALDSVAKVEPRPGATWRAYRCQRCDGWHVTDRPEPALEAPTDDLDDSFDRVEAFLDSVDRISEFKTTVDLIRSAGGECLYRSDLRRLLSYITELEEVND